MGSMTARSFVYDGVRQVSVSNFGEGAIVIEPGPQDTSVEGTLSAADGVVLEAISIRQDHEQLRIEIPARPFRPSDVHLRLGVPAGLEYNVSSGSADIRITADAGRTRIASGSGDISLGLVRNLTCTSGSGDVAVVEVTGDAAKVNSGSGDIQINTARCPVSAKSGSGDLVIKSLQQASLQASSGSGDISVPATTGSVDLRSASGSLTVGVADNLPAWLDLHSVSGNVRIALVASSEPAPGEAYVSIRARTASGEIAIYRA
jgi:DUF4097 and DUF4098 domain-containing protein YvlB